MSPQALTCRASPHAPMRSIYESEKFDLIMMTYVQADLRGQQARGILVWSGAGGWGLGGRGGASMEVVFFVGSTCARVALV